MMNLGSTLCIIIAFICLTLYTPQLTTAVSICDPKHPMNTLNTWTWDQFYPVLHEDFNGTELNETLFNYVESDERFNYGFACGRQSLCMKKNAIVQDGKLILRALTNDPQQSPTNASRIFFASTAGVTTKDKVTVMQDGKATHRICMRTTLPHEKIYNDPATGDVIDPLRWSWPAFWSLGNASRNWMPPPTPRMDPFAHDVEEEENVAAHFDLNTHNVKRPMSFDEDGPFADILQSADPEPAPGEYKVCNPDEFEFDLIETNEGGDWVDRVGHWQHNTPQETCKYPTNHRGVSIKHFVNKTLPHDFDAEWGPDFISVYLDGVHLQTWTVGVPYDKAGVKPFWFNNTAPYYLMINNAYGGIGENGKLQPDWIAKFAPKHIDWEIDHLYILRSDNAQPGFFSKDLLAFVVVGAIFSVIVWSLYKMAGPSTKEEQEQQQQDERQQRLTAESGDDYVAPQQDTM